jgi:hypothetical protein
MQEYSIDLFTAKAQLSQAGLVNSPACTLDRSIISLSDAVHISESFMICTVNTCTTMEEA